MLYTNVQDLHKILRQFTSRHNKAWTLPDRDKRKDMVLRPCVAPKMELWCNANLYGNWNPDSAHIDRMTAKSRTGYIVMFAGCPITLASKLQTEMALTTTKAEFIALRKGLPTTIRMIDKMGKEGM